MPGWKRCENDPRRTKSPGPRPARRTDAERCSPTSLAPAAKGWLAGPLRPSRRGARGAPSARQSGGEARLRPSVARQCRLGVCQTSTGNRPWDFCCSGISRGPPPIRKPLGRRGTVPFCFEDHAKFGQSSPVFGSALILVDATRAGASAIRRSKPAGRPAFAGSRGRVERQTWLVGPLGPRQIGLTAQCGRGRTGLRRRSSR